MNKLFITAFCILLCTQTAQLQSQTTIGNDKQPVAGALLQLKQDEQSTTNSSKGLGLPRVNLTDVSNLYPMFTSGSAAYTGAKKTEEDANHIGLVVYNTNQCLQNTRGIAMGSGFYVWDGAKWQATNGLDVAFDELPTETSANSNRADWQSEWGKRVIRHQAKTGVYEEFTSADFGAAGRWMTTNLSAKAYDGITHDQSRNFVGPNGNSNNAFDAACWAYPSITSPTTETEYEANKSLGFLYTWDAATAGKGGLNGQTGSNQAGTNHSNTQGVCPQGWHLPSDYEWTELENAIIQNTSQYSSLPDINSSNPNTFQQNTTSTGTWRGTHGTAMKGVCDTRASYSSGGASKPVSQGGFAAPLAGFALTNKSFNFGQSSDFWTSSSHSATTAWKRDLDKGASVNYYHCGRGHLLSVRCKKNVN